MIVRTIIEAADATLEVLIRRFGWKRRDPKAAALYHALEFEAARRDRIAQGRTRPSIRERHHERALAKWSARARS